MHVYLVRHGETLQNRRHIHQSPNVALSPEGRNQVLSTAEYLRVTNPDLLLTSEYTRAIETARIIGLYVGLVPKTNGLFYEIVRPSKLFDSSVLAPETFWYTLLSIIKRKQSAWRYADAENFTDIDTRARKALAYLESLQDTHNSVVVVSHTIFINIMLLCMCKKWPPGAWDLFSLFYKSKKMKNGGIIHVEYIGHAEGNTCAWRIVDRV